MTTLPILHSLYVSSPPPSTLPPTPKFTYNYSFSAGDPKDEADYESDGRAVRVDKGNIDDGQELGEEDDVDKVGAEVEEAVHLKETGLGKRDNVRMT